MRTATSLPQSNRVDRFNHVLSESVRIARVTHLKIDAAIDGFLVTYRSTQHSTTEVLLVELIISRRFEIPLDQV